jgi:HK97 family phage prohead protease
MTMQRRDFTLSEIKVSQASDDAGTFSGYGAIFGNVDSYGDIIKAGAFAKSLKEWGAKGKLPPMLLQHGGGVFGGGADDMLPVGKWLSMEENSKGLKVEGHLFAMNTERGQYIYEGLKSGVLDGLSIGFMTRNSEEEIIDGERYRILTDIDLWELSIVTFPANDKARVASVKNQLRDIEDSLRDAGLSRADCRTAISVLKRQGLLRDAGVPEIAPRDAVAPEDERAAAELLASLDRMTGSLISAALRR